MNIIDPKRICFSCGHLVGADTSKCQYCGSVLPAVSRTADCQACGKPFAFTRLACPWCNDMQTIPCRGCGNDIAGHWQVCPICGTLQRDITLVRIPEKPTSRLKFWILLVLLMISTMATAYCYRGELRGWWKKISENKVESANTVALPRK